MWVKPVVAALVAGIAGAAVWAVSVSFTGEVEPWDAEVSFFVGGLLVAGLVAGLLAPFALWAHYCGGIAGQLLYMLCLLPTGPLVVVGALMLTFYTLWLLAGSFVGMRIRSALVVFFTQQTKPSSEP